METIVKTSENTVKTLSNKDLISVLNSSEVTVNTNCAEIEAETYSIYMTASYCMLSGEYKAEIWKDEKEITLTVKQDTLIGNYLKSKIDEERGVVNNYESDIDFNFHKLTLQTF